MTLGNRSAVEIVLFAAGGVVLVMILTELFWFVDR
jgi:hypothetical protein